MIGTGATIYALATPPGRSGVAVIRVSGSQAAATLNALAGRVPPPRLATLRRLRDPATERMLDKALILYFKGPDSYTGEDTAEYHVHGGRAVIDGVLAALDALPDCRLAEPGEFTRRAFENGKLDLTEAEAVADLIEAETFLQREQALQQMGGTLARLYEGWTGRIAGLLAHAEADIDFPEEDLPEGLNTGLSTKVEAVLHEIRLHLDDGRRGEILREGVRIAVLGAPNAGKSSLINALAKRDISIVSPMAGTTRDVIEAHLQIDGFPVIVSDTAGLRETSGDDGHAAVETEGIRRARVAADEADIRLLVFDASLLPVRDDDTAALGGGGSLTVYNKADLAEDLPTDGVAVSALRGDGLAQLADRLGRMITDRFGGRPDAALTRRRHRDALVEAADALARALEAPLLELTAEDLRLAVRALGRITGRVDVEDLLDRIFRDFCIGK